MIFVNKLEIDKSIFIDLQSNGILTAFDKAKKPFLVYDLGKQKALFANVRKAKKTAFVCSWLCDFFDGKKEIVYSNGTIFAVKNGKLGFYKLQNIA